MSKYEEEKKRYLVVRKLQDDSEAIATIDDYSGNVYWTESIDSASKFETLDEAKKLVKLQADLGKLLKKEWQFEILEEHRAVSAAAK